MRRGRARGFIPRERVDACAIAAFGDDARSMALHEMFLATLGGVMEAARARRRWRRWRGERGAPANAARAATETTRGEGCGGVGRDEREWIEDGSRARG